MKTDLKAGDIVWYITPNILFTKNMDFSKAKIIQGKVLKVEDIDSFVAIYVLDNDGYKITMQSPKIVFKSEDEAKIFINEKINNKES